MGVIRAEISMSQPANVIYTHKKFKRTSSQSWKEGSAEAAALPCSVASGHQHSVEAVPDDRNSWASQDRDGAESLLIAASLVEQRDADERLQRMSTSETCAINGTGGDVLHFSGSAPARGVWSCSYCKFSATREDEVRLHEAQHSRLCSNCRAPEVACYCDQLTARQSRPPASSLSSSLPSNNCQFTMSNHQLQQQVGHPIPADLSATSTKLSNNNFPNDGYSQRELQPTSHSAIEVTAAGKNIYKPKFRVSYSLDESSSGISSASATSACDDVFEASEAKHNVPMPYNLASTSSDLKSTINLPRHVTSLPAVKGDEPGTALKLGSIVRTGLWKGIKSPSPDLGEHIDKLIDQNKLIMDSDNPFRNRKYRRQSSIGGSSSSENENSSGIRSRRTSATDSTKCKTSGVANLPNRMRVQTLVDIPPGQASVAVPHDTHSSLAYKRSVSALGQSTGHPLPNLKFSTAAQIVPSSHFTPADLKRFLSVDNSSSAQTTVPLVPSTSLDLEVCAQQILSNPDSETHKLLVARGNTHGLQGTSIIPIVNPQVLVLVCPNCSASFRTRESLEIHLERHCNGKLDDFSAEKGNPSHSRSYFTNRNGPLQDSSLDLQKREDIRDLSPAQMRSSSVENEPHVKNSIEETSQGRGSSLGADIRLNVDHMKPSFRSTSPYSRQQLADVGLPSTKKRKLSSETQSSDFVTSVHPVLVHNGVVFQRARVSVKAVDDSKRPPNKHQLCGGEVKICDGTEYKTMRIDTSDCSRNLALDMCLTNTAGSEVKVEHESRTPTSQNIVTLSKSGLNCGGTMVESRVSCLATSSSASPAARRDSSCSDASDTQPNFVNSKAPLKFGDKDLDLPSISLSNLQQYAPQLQLPNLSIPGVPIPNISGVMLSKLSSSQASAMKPKRNSLTEHTKTTINFTCSSTNANGKASYKYLADPAIISVGKEKVPYVPGIPGPYSQPSPNSAMNTSLTSPKSGPKFNTIPLISFKPEKQNDEKSRSDPARFLSNVSAPKNSLFVPTKVDLPYGSSLAHASPQLLMESEKLPMSVASSDQKDIFLAPRKRPDTLPLKPQQFVSKSTAQLIGSTIMSPDTPRPKKSCAQLLLDGSAYTYLGLKVSTKTFYCCIYRPQPMYVPQSPDSKISMYSNWQIRKPAEDNPFNLSISEAMGLYSSRRYTDTAYSVAKPTTLIYTYSNDKIIEAFAQLRNREKSASASFQSSTSEKRLGSGGSPCKSSKVTEGVSDLKVDEMKVSMHGIASSSSREPSDDSRLSSTSSRVRICDGGFKSTEEYTYVRGRGRGRYVCETCGIRCKKPSMLKKHIRTHTNFRPYPCTLCTSRFKTKGNLTKHLKSKAHYKKCLQHGLPHDSSGGDDASTEMDFDEDDDDDDEEEGEEDDDDEDDECEDDARESRENSSMRDSSRENSYFRDSSRENSYVNESREGSCFRDSRENSYFRESRENSYVRDSRENSYIRDSRENSYVGESRENSCIRESRENSCLRDGSLEKTFLSSNNCGSGLEKSREGASDGSSLCPFSASSAVAGRSQKFAQVQDTGMDLRVSSVACRSIPQLEVTHPTAADDAPIDLSIKKSCHDPAPKSDHGLFSSLLSRGVSCTKNVPASRPNFLPIGLSSSGMSLVSALPVKSPITPIREQPADILSPVTESSMLLKSIYNTTERASRASSVLHNQASYPSSIPNSQASGVMMKAYLTERAIQDTFIKRHQYQGSASFADASRESSLSVISSEPATIHKLVSKTEQLRLSTGNDIISRNSVVNVPGDSQSVQVSTSVKPKNYYCGKLHGAKLSNSPVYPWLPSSGLQVSAKPNANQKFPACSVSVVSSTPPFELPKSSCSTAFASYRSLDGVLVDDATFKGKLRAAFDLVEASDKRRALSNDDPYEPKSFVDSSGKLIMNTSTSVVTAAVEVPCALPRKAHIMNASRTSMPPKTSSQLTVSSHVVMAPVSIARVSTQDSLSIVESIQKPSLRSLSTDNSRVSVLSDSVQQADIVSFSSTNQPKYLHSSLASTSPVSSASGVPGVQKRTENTQGTVSSPAPIFPASSTYIIVARDHTQSHATAKLTSSEPCLSTESSPSPVIESSARSSPIIPIVTSSVHTSVSNSNTPPASVSTPSSSSSDGTRQESIPSSPSHGSPRSLAAPQSSPCITAARNVTVSVPSSPNTVAQRSVTVPAPSSSSVGGSRSMTVPAPSSAMNLTVLNSSDSKSGASFLSPSGVVPNPANNRAAPEDGRCRCYICQKEFARSSQLSLHMNIHYMERPFRCDSCSVSFRTSGHLQKHKRSASHFNKVNMNLTFGAASTDNPRPFKCDECKIAFRIHGHLAKHLRSKMHILRLECVAKLPFGLYAEMERTGYPLANIDTTDCEHSLISLQGLADKLFAKEPEKLVAWRKAAAALAKAKKNKNRPRSVSGSSCNSDEYLLADDQDDPSALPDSGDENDSSPCSRGGADSMSPSRSPQSPASLAQATSFTAPSSSNSSSSTSSTSGPTEKTHADFVHPVSSPSISSPASILAASAGKSSSASPEIASSTHVRGASSSPVPSSLHVSTNSLLGAQTSPAAKSRPSSLSPASAHSASA